MSVADESALAGVRQPESASISQPPHSLGREDGRPAVGVQGGGEQDGEQQAEPYYWEEGGDPNVDLWSKVRHALHFGGIKAIAGAEVVGEVVADTLGLNDSKYQYVIDALEADEIRRKREERDEEDRRQMELKDEAARNDAQQQLRDQQATLDADAVELGDAVVSVPGGTSRADAAAGGAGLGEVSQSQS